MSVLLTDRVSVLVVDDDAAIRALISTLLKRTNAYVDCVPDGAVALSLLEKRSYSVVILYLMMQGTNGFEVLQRVAETMPELLKRIIVLTAVSSKTLEQLDDQKTEVWGVIRKPFDID